MRGNRVKTDCYSRYQKSAIYIRNEKAREKIKKNSTPENFKEEIQVNQEYFHTNSSGNGTNEEIRLRRICLLQMKVFPRENTMETSSVTNKCVEPV